MITTALLAFYTVVGFIVWIGSVIWLDPRDLKMDLGQSEVKWILLENSAVVLIGLLTGLIWPIFLTATVIYVIVVKFRLYLTRSKS